MEPKYPEIKVKLTNKDGNAFMIIGECNRAAKKAGLKKEERDVFLNEALGSGSYDALLQTCMKYFYIV